ncbi:hypothetical protein DFQ27_006584 [Actinomortierella ambigua]|uniref:Uncharacterized protein n=1 Tax=Actinomortierella ambigua TaxID=1343610 RepID=A0A9P6U0A4_9FUNG|nr:hypothetical protein DFQ27_006584 [Actinomortierella ambigua]
MPQLVIDVIALILDKIDDAGTLFSLLTVGKDVFYIASQILYRDPGVFLPPMQCKSRHASTVAFVRLVLAISPAKDNNTNLLRQAFSVNPPSSPPVLDYLALIRVVQWKDLFRRCLAETSPVLDDMGHSGQPLGGPYDHLQLGADCLTKAVCLHQLGNIVELEIQLAGHIEYLHRASELSSLKKVIVENGRTQNAEDDAYTFAVRLVKAIRLHHGRNRLRDCLVRNQSASRMLGDLLPQQIELDSLLPPPEALKSLQIASPRPMDRYLSNAENLDIALEKYEIWKSISQHYPDLPAWRALQRCRSLSSLTFEIAQHVVDGSSLFAWAAKEARDRDAGRFLAPAVPLEDLNLYLSALDACGARRPDEGARDDLDGDGDGGKEDDPLAWRQVVDDETWILP